MPDFTEIERLDAAIDRLDRARDRQAHVADRWAALTHEIDALVAQRIAATKT